MDFQGTGKVTLEAMQSNYAVKNLMFSEADLNDCLFREGVFTNGASSQGIDFDAFKKHFFPHMINIQDNYDIEDEEDKNWELRK